MEHRFASLLCSRIIYTHGRFGWRLAFGSFRYFAYSNKRGTLRKALHGPPSNKREASQAYPWRRPLSSGRNLMNRRWDPTRTSASADCCTAQSIFVTRGSKTSRDEQGHSWQANHTAIHSRFQCKHTGGDVLLSSSSPDDSDVVELSQEPRSFCIFSTC